MIPFGTLDKAILPRIDEEGTDAHDLNLDRIPAVNAAQRLIQSAVTSLLEAKKYSGEGLRDLNYTAVFQTSMFGQIDIDRILGSLPDPDDHLKKKVHKLWSVVAVYPEFTSEGAQEVTYDPVQTRSSLRADVRFTAPLRDSKHLTQQQWAGGETDVFSPGSSLLTNTKLRTYGHLFGTRAIVETGAVANTTLTVVGIPDGKRQLVAVGYLKVPDMVPPMPGGVSDPLYTSTRLEWPDSMMELLVAVACRMVTMKQGDNTTLNSLSGEEAAMLIRAIA